MILLHNLFEYLTLFFHFFNTTFASLQFENISIPIPTYTYILNLFTMTFFSQGFFFYPLYSF